MISNPDSATIFVNAYPSPLGWIWTASVPEGVLCLCMPSRDGKDGLLRELHRIHGPARIQKGGPLHSIFLKEMEGYFSGSLKSFDIPPILSGTPFQRRVWQIVSQIPYGETLSYGEVAEQLEIPKGARAVGQANRRNPVPLLVPCHRVTGSGGKLGGYSSGTEQKRWLLEWESQNWNSLS